MTALLAPILIGLAFLLACVLLRPGPHRFPHPDSQAECHEATEAVVQAGEPLVPPQICMAPRSRYSPYGG